MCVLLPFLRASARARFLISAADGRGEVFRDVCGEAAARASEACCVRERVWLSAWEGAGGEPVGDRIAEGEAVGEKLVKGEAVEELVTGEAERVERARRAATAASAWAWAAAWAARAAARREVGEEGGAGREENAAGETER